MKNKTFEQQAQQWWDPNGIFKPLHQLAPLRLKYIQQQYGALNAKNVLDIGCGGGLVAEKLAQQNAIVTAIDPTSTAIKIAQQHAKQQGLQINYQALSLEQYYANFAEQQKFDLIVCFDVLQHLTSPYSILPYVRSLLKDNGEFIVSTVNRTLLAYFVLILGAEKMAKILPRGTNQYSSFIKSDYLQQKAQQAGFIPLDITGYAYLPWQNQAKFVPYCGVNYFMSFEVRNL